MQDVIQQAVDAAERALPGLSVCVIRQLSAFFVEALVRDSVVAGEQLEMAEKVHTGEYTDRDATFGRWNCVRRCFVRTNHAA